MVYGRHIYKPDDNRATIGSNRSEGAAADMNTPEIERTAAGLQYVIPGAERRVPAKRKEFSRDGDQFVLPGAERISMRDLLARRMAMPVVARRGQRAITSTPLFRR